MAAQLPHKNQLRWRCRRGMQELDILLLRYLEQDFDQADHSQQQAFIALLQQQDDLLWDWLSGRHIPEQPAIAALIKQINQATHSISD